LQNTFEVIAGASMTSKGNEIERRAGKFVFSKDAFVLLPLIGTALAVIYEVGFFSGIGPFYFTMFSLAEHVVFALTFLPAAIFITVLFVVYVYFLGDQAEKFILKYIPRAQLWLHDSVRAIPLYVVTVAVFALNLYASPHTRYTMIAAAISLVALALAYRRSMFTKFVCGLLAVVVCAFAFGHDAAEAFYGPLRPSVSMPVIELEDGKQIPARIVRAGDSGVLFVDAAGAQMTLVRWSQIKQITSSR